MALTAMSTQQLWIPKQNWGLPQSILDSEGASEAASLPEEPATVSDCGGGARWVMSYEKEGALMERKKDVRE